MRRDFKRGGWFQGWCAALACAACSAGAADGDPDYGATLPAFGAGGSTAVVPQQPSNPNAPNESSTPVASNTTAGSETNQTGGGPVAPSSGSGGNTSASSGTGAAGTGGTAGSGNVGAAGGQNLPTNPPAMLPEPPGDAFFFDDFEAGAAGTQPAAWNRWLNHTTSAGNAVTGAQFALLDSQEHFKGNQSVHFHVTEGTQPAQLTFAVPANTNRLFVRAYVKSTTQLGSRQPDNPSNHETLIALRAGSGKADFELRFGEAKGALGFNIVGDGRSDAVAPPQALWGSAPSMAANQWHCVEVDFLNDNPASPQAHASVDGALVRSVTSLADWHVMLQGQGAQWLNGMFGEVVIGWQSFSNPPANDVWMDDVVLSNSPIGCE
ncbi:MAG: hypothetical protein ABI895_00945 [Deltaproteobacteria bacterium]